MRYYSPTTISDTEASAVRLTRLEGYVEPSLRRPVTVGRCLRSGSIPDGSVSPRGPFSGLRAGLYPTVPTHLPSADKAAAGSMTLQRRSKRLSPCVGRVGGRVTAARHPPDADTPAIGSFTRSIALSPAHENALLSHQLGHVRASAGGRRFDVCRRRSVSISRENNRTRGARSEPRSNPNCMNSDATHGKDDYGRTEPMTTNHDRDHTRDRDRDPGAPPARLSGAEKQLVLAIEALEAEAEHIDPEIIERLETATELVRTVDRELRMLEEVTDEEVSP